MKLDPPGAIYCRTCGYCLHGLPSNRCPECGNDFDPADPKSFRRTPRRLWPRRLLVWGGIPLLLLGLAYGGFLTWLYVGWRDEAGARALATGPYDQVKTRSLLPSALSRLLVGDCRAWQERVDMVRVQSHPLNSEQFRSIAACRRLHRLHLIHVPLKGQDVALLCQSQELEHLELYRASIHGEDLVPLSRLVHLKKLQLYDNPQLDDAALPAIGTLKELRFLQLAYSGITDAGMPHLAGLQNLEELHVNACPKLTDAAVPQLSGLTGLKLLSLYGTRLTPEGFAALRAALPQCKIYGH